MPVNSGSSQPVGSKIPATIHELGRAEPNIPIHHQYTQCQVGEDIRNTHDWSKWERVEERLTVKNGDDFPFVDHVQERSCSRCGFVESNMIRRTEMNRY